MKKFIFVIPTVIIVGIVSLWKLEKDFPEIDSQTQWLITAGAMVLSGVISYFLLGSDGEKFGADRKK